LLFLILPLALFAEIPPMPEGALRNQASAIVTGTIQEVKTHPRAGKEGFSDTIYLFTVAVEKVEKGQVGKTILVEGWRVLQRPAGWVGPGGNFYLSPKGGQIFVSSLKVGQSVRCFLQKRAADGTYSLLAPNGFALL
jgi:hypothetical protein